MTKLYERADEDQVKQIFTIVDQEEPIDVNRRVTLGEKIANKRGLTLKINQRRGHREFNPFIRRNIDQ